MSRDSDYQLTTHHIYFPRSDYRSALEQAFRELPEHKVVLPFWFHNLLHQYQSPPEKPSPEIMRQAILRSQAHLRYRHLLGGG